MKTTEGTTDFLFQIGIKCVQGPTFMIYICTRQGCPHSPPLFQIATWARGRTISEYFPYKALSYYANSRF